MLSTTLCLQNRNFERFAATFFLFKKNANNKLNFLMIFKLYFMYFYRGFFSSTLGLRWGGEAIAHFTSPLGYASDFS